MSLTRQLLVFSRKRITRLLPVDLNVIVRDISKMLSRLIGEDIRLLVSSSAPTCPIVADTAEIEQVLMNLVINARDAMPKGGSLKIETRTMVLDDAHVAFNPGAVTGPHAVLEVSDTGHGIDTEIRQRIFDPFFTTKPRGQGTGLGLATVHGIITQANGHITVETEVNRGTTFRLYIPHAKDLPIVNERVHSNKTHAERGVETILVVEDDALVRHFIVRTLRDAGYTAIEADAPSAAMRIVEARAGRIHLLLTDVILPEMSGRELAEHLCSKCQGMQVLFMSGYTDDAVLRHGIMANEIAFLRKPFTADELARKLREALDVAPPSRMKRFAGQ